ncbi:hypothetical protein SUGI_0904360 [Cryptomeria japonica]|nr:hypothetical protein SUGI_0904360 [Cryptomeria japonica]
MDLGECSESRRISAFEGAEEESEGNGEKMEENQALINRVAVGKLRESEVGQDNLDAFRKDEIARVDAILEKYIIFCSNFKIKAEALKFDKGEAHKVIVGLISELHIRKLVIGTSSCSIISRKMKRTGDKADYVQKHAPDLCKLYIVCKGKLVYLKGHDDPGNQEALFTSKACSRIAGFEGIPERHVNISPCIDSEDISEDIERYFESLVEKNPDYNSMCESTSTENNEASGVMEIISPEPHEFQDQSMGPAMDSENLKMRISQALEEAKNAKNTVLTEVQKCKKAEWATHKSLEKANRYEDLYHKEIRQKEETRELLRTSRQQVLEISRQRDEAIEELIITRQSLRILGNLANEVSAKRDHASQDLQNVLETIIKLKLQIFKNGKERDSTLRELKTHHNRDQFQLNDYLYREYSCDDRDAIIHALQLEDEEDEDSHQASEVPGFFMCPILQDVMQDPHIAADGFSYEFESIKGWIDSGHDTSPMTNLKLSHMFLFPNYSLRSAIRHWQQRRIIFSSLGSK